MAIKPNGASPDKRRTCDEAFKTGALRRASESRRAQAAARQDRCLRKIVDWDVRENMPENLVSEALGRVMAGRRPPAGLVVHSD